jgi:hypothetical protein
LPPDGESLLGPVRLPNGRRATVLRDTGGDPVAWVTFQPTAEAGRLWLACSGLADQTGLRPLLQVASDGDTGYLPTYEYVNPHQAALADELDAATLLGRGWGDGLLEDWGDLEEDPFGFSGLFDDYDIWSDPDFASQFAPYGEQFPGLAPGTSDQVPEEAITRALDRMGSAYLALVETARPADILSVIGWRATDKFQKPLAATAVLRSWEDRFGARLLRIGPSAQVWLAVERPPRSLDTATAVAAELRAFAPVWIDHRDLRWQKSVSDISPRLVDNPLWGFWWD